MYGFQVYETEVDDRGIDFIIRFNELPFLEIQVKSLRSLGYAFAQKEKFKIRDNIFMALVLFKEGEAPSLFIIPATAWLEPNELIVSRDYTDLKSKPEWGINISQRNMPILEQYQFENMISVIRGEL